MLGVIMILVFLVIVFGIGIVGYKYFKESVQSDKEKENYIPTTQDNLPIDWIRRGVVKMKNGAYAVVIKLPSINIDLMEADERQVVFSQYRQVLSSIEFPFQFLQQSRVVDIDDYLKKLEKIKRSTENQFIKVQLSYYNRYMQELVNSRAILTRKFYLIVPFDELKEQKEKAKSGGSAFDFNMNKKKKAQQQKQSEKDNVIEEEKKFEIAFKSLTTRADTIMRAFSRFEGVTPERLNDEQLTELFYTSYNKNRSVYQPLRANELKDREYYNLYVKKEGK